MYIPVASDSIGGHKIIIKPSLPPYVKRLKKHGIILYKGQCLRLAHPDYTACLGYDVNADAWIAMSVEVDVAYHLFGSDEGVQLWLSGAHIDNARIRIGEVIDMIDTE